MKIRRLIVEDLAGACIMAGPVAPEEADIPVEDWVKAIEDTGKKVVSSSVDTVGSLLIRVGSYLPSCKRRYGD